MKGKIQYDTFINSSKRPETFEIRFLLLVFSIKTKIYKNQLNILERQIKLHQKSNRT